MKLPTHLSATPMTMTLLFLLLQSSSASLFAFSDTIPVILNPIKVEELAIRHPKYFLPPKDLEAHKQELNNIGAPAVATTSEEATTTVASSTMSKLRRSLSPNSVGLNSRRSKHLMLTKPFWPWP